MCKRWENAHKKALCTNYCDPGKYFAQCTQVTLHKLHKVVCTKYCDPEQSSPPRQHRFSLWSADTATPNLQTSLHSATLLNFKPLCAIQCNTAILLRGLQCNTTWTCEATFRPVHYCKIYCNTSKVVQVQHATQGLYNCNTSKVVQRLWSWKIFSPTLELVHLPLVKSTITVLKLSYKATSNQIPSNSKNSKPQKANWHTWRKRDW